jgi:hypothetical protein
VDPGHELHALEVLVQLPAVVQREQELADVEDARRHIAQLGAAAGTLLQNPALVAVLRGIGIMKADFSLPWWLPAGIALAASLAAAGMIWWRSRSLGRVGTRSLLRDAT